MVTPRARDYNSFSNLYRMPHPETLTRRNLIAGLAGATTLLASPATPPAIDRAIIDRNDSAVDRLLVNQVTSQTSPYRGSVPDEYLLHPTGSAGGLIEACAAALVCPQSRFHNDAALLERIRLAAGFLERSQSPEGNIDLLSTNFNSPPDTGFVVHNVGTAAALGRLYGNEELVRALRPFLVRAGAGMAAGGIHTPNHRWVVSSALAQINELFPDPAYTRRIDQWLAEGIDIDEEGQFIERSTVTYNTVCDRALTVLAAKLRRPALLDAVRRNLAAMVYLIHPDGEVVTEVSRRQDQFTRGTMAGYWFPAAYLAAHDRDPMMIALARSMPDGAPRLSTLLEYPELASALPDAPPLPENYEKLWPLTGLARIRRGPRDATLVLGESSRFFSGRNGAVVIQAVRFATSFFGKGQFVPATASKTGGSYVFRQSLEAPYYQPLAPSQIVTSKNWAALRERRRRTQICRLEQTATITERDYGFHIRIESRGTPGVPLAIEISLREGGKLEGCVPAPHATDSWILTQGFATYAMGDRRLRIGPGTAPHLQTQLRGAEAKLPGTSVYLTGLTPFDHAIELHYE
jgi:hypothetical protein